MVFSIDFNMDMPFAEGVKRQKRAVLLLRKKYLLSDTVEDAEYEVISEETIQ